MAVVRIVVSGSREWCNRAHWTEYLTACGLEGDELASAVETLMVEQFERTAAALRWAYEQARVQHPDAEVVLVHGDAQGADRTCGGIWRAKGLTVQVEPAHWKVEGKGAGFIRNLRMLALENVQVVLAFHVDRSPGTEHLVANAVAQGIPVWLWAHRDDAAKASVRITSENIMRFYPPLGKGHRTLYMQARKTPAPVVQEPLPLLDVEPAVYYDRASGGLRCGECGEPIDDRKGSIARHMSKHALVTV